MSEIDGVATLESWLEQAGIDTTAWGKCQAKSVDALWKELKQGEITLQREPLLREVEVVQIIIRRDAFVLLEVEQELGNGEHRSRNIFPSEKLRSGEDFLTAAKRGLQEEMDLNPQTVIFLSHSYKKKQHTNSSPSYPNLPTRYTIHSIEAVVSELPLGDFWCENQAHTAGDPVKQHCWGWRTEAEMVALS